MNSPANNIRAFVASTKKNYNETIQDIIKSPKNFSKQNEDQAEYSFDEQKVLAVRNLIIYLGFLGLFIAIIFLPNDDVQSFLTQNSIRTKIGSTATSSGVTFEAITAPAQWYDFMREVLIPSVNQQTFYNGKPFPRNKAATYQPSFVNDVNLVLGLVRIRQVRMQQEPSCKVISFLKDKVPPCQMRYSPSYEDKLPWALKSNTSHPLIYQYGYQLGDGSNWQSPVTQLFYGAGGYIVDLPASMLKSIERIDMLEQGDFIDYRTRAVFVDFSTYNPNNDHFLFARLVLEVMPTGLFQPVIQIDAAPINRDNRALLFQPGANTGALAALILEFLLYCFVTYQISRWVEEICNYDSFMQYMTVPWNFIDMSIVLCFAYICSFRAVYMIQMVNFSYNVADNIQASQQNFDKFVPMRQKILMYRVDRNFFAMAVLLAFLKAFKFIGVTKRLAQFTDTIFFAYKPMMIMSCIIGVALVGYAIAFVMSFGNADINYEGFATSMLSLFMAVLGQFSLNELRYINPVLGVILLFSFVLIILFVTLSMLLKVVDNTYEKVVEEFLSGEKENFGKQLKQALITVLSDIYWGFMIKKTLYEAKRLRKIAEEAQGNNASALAQESFKIAAVEKQKEAEEMQRNVQEEKNHRENVIARSHYRSPITSIETINQASEEDVTFTSIEDRIQLFQHRQAILLKMATRLARSVEVQIARGNGLDASCRTNMTTSVPSESFQELPYPFSQASKKYAS